MRHCRYCDREFLANRDWQDFCCSQHRQRWHYRQQKNGHGRGIARIDLVALGAVRPLPRRKITNNNTTRAGTA